MDLYVSESLSIRVGGGQVGLVSRALMRDTPKAKRATVNVIMRSRFEDGVRKNE